MTESLTRNSTWHHRIGSSPGTPAPALITSPPHRATMSNGPQRRLESTNTVEAERESPRPGIATATQHSDAEFQDVNPVFSKLPPEAVVAIAEALVARGLIQTLGNFNATSKGVNKVTLPTLWRTVVWKPRKEAVEEKTARWKRIMVNAKGSRYIQSVFLPVSSYLEPPLILHLPATDL